MVETKRLQGMSVPNDQFTQTIMEEEFETFYNAQSRNFVPNGQLPANNANPGNCQQMMETINRLLQQNSQLVEIVQRSQMNNCKPDVLNVCSMPDVSKKIQPFDGQSGSLSAKTWIKQLESLAALHKWPESTIFQLAITNLTGAAKYWFSGRIENVTNWTQFKVAFQKSFISEHSTAELWTKMQKRVQQPRENITNYFYEKWSLCKELSLSFMESKEQVAIGLWSKDLSNFILSRQHQNEDELHCELLSFERIDNARRVRVKEKKNFTPNLTIGSEVQAEVKNIMKQPISSINVEPNRDSNNKIRCYNCGCFGHRNTECRKPVREKGSCYNCG